MILALLLSVFTVNDIELRTSRDVAELLREAPGVAVEEGALSLRGADPQHTRILWNGVEIEEPFTGIVDIDRFSTAGVTRVEVSGGTVNLLTNADRTSIRAIGEAGADELRLVNGSASYVRGVHSANAALEMFEVDDVQRRTAHALYRFTLPAFSIGLIARGVDHETETIAFEGEERLIAIPVTQTLGRFSYELQLSQQERSDGTREPLVTEIESTTRRARLVTRVGGFLAGVERKTSEASEEFDVNVFIEGAEQNATAVFVEQHVTLDLGEARLEARAGLRYDDYDTFGDELSPRLALAYSFSGNTIRAGFAEGFRAPALRELYDPFLGDESLDAERSRTYEIGFSRGALHATAFHSDYEDRIEFDVTEQRFVNGGDAEVDGIELAYARAFGPLSTRLSYTHLDREDVLREDTRNLGSLFVGYAMGRLRAAAILVRQETTTVDANVQFDLGKFTPYVKLEERRDDRRLVGGIRFVR